MTQMQTGMLILTRTRQYADRLRRYRVIVDGQEVGRLRAGEELRVELPEGEHRMVARMDWKRSNDLSFGIRAGETTDVEVGANARGWLVIAAVYFVLSGQYLYLRHRVTGFPVKTAGGTGER